MVNQDGSKGIFFTDEQKISVIAFWDIAKNANFTSVLLL